MSARILVIDDEANLRTMIRLTLQHAGYTVETAGDGREGLEKYGTGAEWDLVLLDQRMPGMTGDEVQAEIYQRRRDQRLILITAFGTIDLAIQAIRAGAADFLRKPFTADTLRSSVETALQKEVQKVSAVPVDFACREFTRTTINGFSFEFDHEIVDEHVDDLTTVFQVSKPGQPTAEVRVILPAYVMELTRAYADSETLPGGQRFWQAMCEEALANSLWQNAELPEDDVVRIDDLSTTLQRWLDSVLTVHTGDSHAR